MCEWLDYGELYRDIDEVRWDCAPRWAKESGPTNQCGEDRFGERHVRLAVAGA